MDIQFCDASRSRRKKRFKNRALKLSERLVARYLTSIGKPLPQEKQNELAAGLANRIVEATEREISGIVAEGDEQVLSEADHLNILMEELSLSD